MAGTFAAEPLCQENPRGHPLAATPLTHRQRGSRAVATAPSRSARDADPGPGAVAAPHGLPEPVRDAIVAAHADALAPVFWYLLPFIAVALLPALLLEQIPLSEVAGLVARGEAIGGEEAEAREAARRTAKSG